jgi:Flp pilus assembly protein TadG
VAHIRGVKGQSAAEFAVIMPLFLLAALGMAQLSLITTAAVMIK